MAMKDVFEIRKGAALEGAQQEGGTKPEGKESLEELRQRFLELAEEHARLGKQFHAELVQTFGDAKSFEEKMEKDPLMHQMLGGASAETPTTEKLKRMEETKVPLFNMLSDAARFRKFALTSETLKQLAAVDAEWRDVSERRRVREGIEKST